MTPAANSPATGSRADLAFVAARWLLAAAFIWLGLNKALHPVEFLKLVRQYGVFDGPMLNVTAVVLPWFEVVCGLFLLLGIAVRGTALVMLVLLVAFTALIVRRALQLGTAGTLPFCAITFDCGCGSGEVAVCRKLGENAGLILLAGVATFARARRWCLRFSVVA